MIRFLRTLGIGRMVKRKAEWLAAETPTEGPGTFEKPIAEISTECSPSEAAESPAEAADLQGGQSQLDATWAAEVAKGEVDPMTWFWALLEAAGYECW